MFQTFEDGVDCGFGLCARQAGALDYVMDNVLFNQWGNLAGETEYDFTTTYSGDATDFGPNMEQRNGFMGVFLLSKRDFPSAGGSGSIAGKRRVAETLSDLAT